MYKLIVLSAVIAVAAGVAINPIGNLNLAVVQAAANQNAVNQILANRGASQAAIAVGQANVQAVIDANRAANEAAVQAVINQSGNQAVVNQILARQAANQGVVAVNQANVQAAIDANNAVNQQIALGGLVGLGGLGLGGLGVGGLGLRGLNLGGRVVIG